METNRCCPNCGKPLGANALEGICPACMLNVGAAPGSAPTAAPDATATMPDVPPSAGRPPPAPLPIGAVFGRYRIGRRLGHGGMGVVYSAEEMDSGRHVALKVIQQRLDSQSDRARFLREGRLAASVNHPNCVYVFGTEEIDGIPVIAMEFVAGGTLEQRLRREGPQPVARAVDAVLQVIAGLEAAQAIGILHRDIKPSNCFEDEAGTVKIGDFGLSISTAPRAETMITEAGTMVGTPAFCSPEQLRGDELSGRTDMYAVGVTLFQLLTGRLPFEGTSLPQLISNTLEKRAPSPRQFRRDIPAGLARVILRCLEKQPSDRFRGYEDLRQALAPYGSTAPTPATLGLRFLAGLLDLLMLNVVAQAAMVLFFGNPFTMLERMMADPAEAWRFVMPTFVVTVSYYALTEWRWGATLGKAICRVTVRGPDGGCPTLAKALARACCYVLLPVLPYWVVAFDDPQALMGTSLVTNLLSFGQFLILGLLFATARRKNGFAAVHDIMTRTRIVSRSGLATRAALASTEPSPGVDESSAQIGPYHVLRSRGGADGTEWVDGYDLRLLRRVLIRRVMPGTPAWPVPMRHVARAGRLRWLTGRRGADENWDAFEGVGGNALLRLCEQPQPWSQVRFWLHDLAGELESAIRDGTMPDVLALDRVWITGDGRAKLFDVPAPGCSDGSGEADVKGDAVPPLDSAGRALAFLREVAAAALGGVAARRRPASEIALPLPIHAQTFLAALSESAGPGPVADAIRPLLRRPATVTRYRQALIIAGCVALPAAGCLALGFGHAMMKKWERDHPALMDLNSVVGTWKSAQLPWIPKQALPSEKLIGIYIATHYRDVINDEDVWLSGFARTMINRKARAFAESSLAAYVSASPEEQAEAEAAIQPILESHRRMSGKTLRLKFIASMFPMLVAVYSGIPAMMVALLFRGGLVLLAAQVTFVRRDGRKASRLRIFWRAVVAWTPVVALAVVCMWAIEAESSIVPALAGVAVCGLAVVSLLLPVRGLQDRLAGTWPVMR